MVPFRAVVFDLYGTLVDNYGYGAATARYLQRCTEMARALGLEPEAFRREWEASYPERTLGRFASLSAAIQRVVHLCGGECPDGGVGQAAELRLEFMREQLTPRPDAVETLRRLRERGVRMGLVSNCGPDTAELWPQTPFAGLIDAPVLSCQVGIRKPDPAIFQLACERVGVRPQEALYVADGEGGELAAAAAVGLTAVLIRCSYLDPPFFRQPHVEPWPGREIAYLSDVLDLVRS